MLNEPKEIKWVNYLVFLIVGCFVISAGLRYGFGQEQLKSVLMEHPEAKEWVYGTFYGMMIFTPLILLFLGYMIQLKKNRARWVVSVLFIYGGLSFLFRIGEAWVISELATVVDVISTALMLAVVIWIERTGH